MFYEYLLVNYEMWPDQNNRFFTYITFYAIVIILNVITILLSVGNHFITPCQ